MIIVLDSNEYINHFNKRISLDNLFSNKDSVIHINDAIIREVIGNIRSPQTKEFYNTIFSKNIEFYGNKLPSVLLEKFKKAGLKKGDIVIAAFCEHINADYLITENMHFLKSMRFDKFKVLSLKDFLLLSM